MEIESLEIGVTVEGADAAAAALDNVDKALADTEESTKRQTAGAVAQSQATTQATAANSKLAAGLGQANQVVAAITTNYGRLSPQVATVAQGFAASASTAMAFGAAFGPIGIGVSALIGFLPAAISLLDGMGTEMDEMNAATERAQQSLSDFISEAQRAAQEREQAARFAAGTETGTEAAGAALQAEARAEAAAAKLEHALTLAGASAETTQAVLQGVDDSLTRADLLVTRLARSDENIAQVGTVRALIRGINELREARIAEDDAHQRAIETADMELARTASAAQAEAAETAAREDEQAQREAAQRASQAARERERAAMEQQRAYEQKLHAEKMAMYQAIQEKEQAAIRLAEEHAQQSQRLAEEAATAAREAERAAISMDQQLMTSAADASRAFADSWTFGLAEVRASFDETNAALEALGSAQLEVSDLARMSAKAAANDVSKYMGGTMVSALESSVDAWLSGAVSFREAAKMMVQGVISELVKHSIVMTVIELAEAITSAARYDFKGAAMHAAAAGTWAAVAGVAGAVGAATGAVGGSGGGSAQSAASGSGVPNLPDSTSSTDTEEPPPPMTINIMGPVVGLAQAGRELQRAERARQSRFGSQS